MTDMNLNHVAAGDTVTFRCGGVATVQKVKESDDTTFYPIELEISGLHTHGQTGWIYDETGGHGDATGPDRQAPFDILRVDREAVTFNLDPVFDDD